MGYRLSGQGYGGLKARQLAGERYGAYGRRNRRMVRVIGGGLNLGS